MVQPQNLDESLQLAIDALALDSITLHRRFRLHSSDSSIALPSAHLVPHSITVYQCLRTVLDLQFTPGRAFFQLLASLSQDEMEREKLTEFGSTPEDYIDYAIRPRRTVAETLRDFPRTSRSLRFDYLFDLLPTLRPRAFSLASCPRTNANQLQILVARVEYSKPRMAEPRRGLCSTFLSRCAVGDRVWVTIRDGTFRFRIDDSHPMIMIGPGTGVAPFRSMINCRRTIGDGELPKSILFFGCRYRHKDYYFEDEWTTMTDSVEVRRRILENS